jgi:uncharacterized protein DUF4279
MKNDVEIDFELWATTIPPREISNRTGIQADVCLAKGERNSKLGLPRENRWSLRSRVQSDNVEDHWQDLERLLVNHKETLREIAETGVARITIIVNSASRIPPIGIPPAMSAFAAFLNATIEIDHLQS